MNALPSSLLVVTDRHQAQRPIEAVVERILEAGGRWIWLRDRDLEASERAALAERLAKMLREAGGCLSIGADYALAARVGAGGVHLGADGSIAQARAKLGARAVIGISAHRIDDVERAQDAGADYVTLSPTFATSSKPGYGPVLGIGAIEAASRLAIPSLALGGVTPDKVALCRRAGAAGVAVMGEIMRGPDELLVVRQFLAAEQSFIRETSGGLEVGTGGR